jgi:hypothetical protein
MYMKKWFSGEWRTQAGMQEEPQLFENTTLRTTKPRITDAGLYSLSNRFKKGCIRGWLPSGDKSGNWEERFIIQ